MKIIYIALLLLTTTASANKPPKQIGDYKNWNVYVMQQNGKKISYIVGTPAKQEGKYKSRGRTYIMITNRPPKSYNVISIHAGYDYPDNYKVKAKIDDKTFNFRTSSETPGTAWLLHEQDTEFAKSLSRGKKLVVYGKSAKGTDTTDTYDLSGSLLALKEARNACGK